MRTTIDIEPQLLKVAKSAAVSQGQTLSAFVNESLRQYLLPTATRTQLTWEPVAFDVGHALPGVDLNSNAALDELLDDEGTGEPRLRESA